MKYSVQVGIRNKAIRLGCEEGLYDFISDYANDIGTSRSAAVRRLVLIGARCEFEHGNARMPASFNDLFFDPEEIAQEVKDTTQKEGQW